MTVSIMSHLVGILKKTGWKSCQDLSLSSDHAGSGKERSEYSDLALARDYENYQEIIENIKTRPRLPLPPAARQRTRGRERTNKRRKNISWRDNTSRASSLDHLAVMRKCLSPARSYHVFQTFGLKLMQFL